MRIALGVLRADAGDVRWGGRSAADLPRSVWGYLPEERGLYPRMTVLEQLVFFGGLYGVPRDIAARRGRSWLRGSASRSSRSDGPTRCQRATSRDQLIDLLTSPRCS